MTTYVRADEAARLLGVRKPTLYAYVSRGKISRTTAPDGRSSLFDLEEVQQLAGARPTAPLPRPTIDVQIASSVTSLSEHGVRFRDHDLTELAATCSFEDVAELLWTGRLRSGVRWPTVDPDDLATCRRAADHAGIRPIGRLAIAAHVLGDLHPDDPPPAAGRRLLGVAPELLGATLRTGSVPERLVSAWTPRASPELVDAVRVAMIVLADHELATSTLAVRVAASVRTTAAGALAAGLATVEGALHGSAAGAAHDLLATCARDGATETVTALRRRGEHVPGFGHKIYRRSDPRFAILSDRVRTLAPARRAAVLDELLAAAGRTIAQQPNIDLALGALSWAADLPRDVPLFAVARVAGWAAHCAEELEAPPVRYRGLARTVV